MCEVFVLSRPTIYAVNYNIQEVEKDKEKESEQVALMISFLFLEALNKRGFITKYQMYKVQKVQSTKRC